VVSAIAALHGAGALGQRLYALLGLVFTGIGAGFAGRHVWLQSLPEDQVPACGPSLEYMLETLPFSQTLKVLLMGDGNCAEVVWTFVGLSIPQLTLGLFVAFGLVLLTILAKPR
jgi:disulfide bond formation protein DsbB